MAGFPRPTRGCLGAWGFAFLLLASAAGRAQEPVDLPLEHWAYEMLQRFEVRAGLGRTGLDMLPLRRGQVARLVGRLQQAAARNEWRPSRIEAQQLDMLVEEFSAELVAQGESLAVLERTAHRWRGADWEFRLFVFAGQDVRFGPTSPGAAFSQTDARLSFEPAAALVLRRDFAAFVPLSLVWRTGDGVLRQSADPRAGEAEYVFEPRDRFSFSRRVEPYARYVHGPVLVDIGREHLRWGPGRQNALLLLDETPPFDLLRLELDFGWLRFTHVAGELRPAQLEPEDPELVQKFIAAHRLVLQPHRRLLLAVSEATVYGDRGLDLAYLNPVNVLYVTQANIGDRDNALGSIDGKLLLPDLELYGEFLVDDLNLRRGLDDFGNKVGALAGFLWLQPFGADDWDLEGEWSWASQFTYTHQTPINRYEHYGLSLGSRAGPDADLWHLGLRRRLSRGWSLQVFYDLERHGEGGLAVDQEERTSDSQDYLSGTVQSSHQPGFELLYRGLRSLDAALEARWLHVTQAQHDPSAAATTDLQLRALTRVEF